MVSWYPQDKRVLNQVLEKFLDFDFHMNKEIHGLIVPHAGYDFSGKIAGKAFSLLKSKKVDSVVLFGPSHYAGFFGLRALEEIETPLGKVNIIKNNFEKLEQEHSVENQIPFLQKLNPDMQILPIVVGEIDKNRAQKIAEQFSKEKALFIFSTDLSHFFPYNGAIKLDKKSIEIIENLDLEKWQEIDACGKFPLLIIMYLCNIKGWKPRLIEYKNSGDIMGDKSSVVGYASFWF